MSTPVSDFERLFSELLDSLSNLNRFVFVATGELSRLDGTIKLMEAIHALRDALRLPADRPLKEDHIRELTGALPFVAAERARGFPFLNGLGAISVWGELEAYVEDLTVEVLISHPPAWQGEPLRKVKAPVGEFVQLGNRERCEWVVQALQRELAVGLRTGVGMFEPVLDAVGLGGSCDPEVRASLVELSAVRNILVHRKGKVDARFIQTCPWMGLRTGDIVNVTGNMLSRYSAATLGYAGEVMRRANSLFGRSDPPLDDLIVAMIPLSQRSVATA